MAWPSEQWTSTTEGHDLSRMRISSRFVPLAYADLYPADQVMGCTDVHNLYRESRLELWLTCHASHLPTRDRGVTGQANGGDVLALRYYGT